LHQGPPSIALGAELALGEFVAPVAERALGELHDVALVHEGHRLLRSLSIAYWMAAHQPLGALARHGLDADADEVSGKRIFLTPISSAGSR
jgi:hypothetical protein